VFITVFISNLTYSDYIFFTALRFSGIALQLPMSRTISLSYDRCYSHDGRVWWRVFPHRENSLQVLTVHDGRENRHCVVLLLYLIVISLVLVHVQ